MKIKPNTYYKKYYTTSIYDYHIWYTDNKSVYIIAEKAYDNPLNKFDKKFKWGTIKSWEIYMTGRNDKIEEMSKEDLFLELL